MNYFTLAEQQIDGYDEVMKNKTYYKPSVTTDVVIFTIEDGILKVLTVKRSNAPFKDSPALPGGFLREKETSEDAVKRILLEKAGVSGVYTEQLYTFDGLKRDPRGPVISIAYYAIVPNDQIVINESEKTENPHFVAVDHLPKLAFDHNDIIKYAVERLQSKLEYTNISYSLLPNSFTLTQLQKIYEAVLSRALDKRNFRKKFLQLGLLEDTGKMDKKGRQRPARLFKFKKRKPAELKKFF